MLLSNRTLTLFSILATVHALPQPSTQEAPISKLLARDPIYTTTTDSTGNTLFRPDYATCANDASISQIHSPPTTSTVTISDCDAAIEAVCAAADTMYKSQVAAYSKGRNPSLPAGITKTVATCEAAILISTIVLYNELTHDECVAAFQKITVPCAVIGTGKYAAVGQQAGVLNVKYTAGASGGCNAYPSWRAPGSDPGYLVGQAGFFGDICAIDASDPLLTKTL